MSSTRNLRKSVLCMAMGACLASLAVAPALAQSATGAVGGRAEAGSQVTVVNRSTGLSRSVTVNADGSYRLSQLPVGDYSLQTTRDGTAVGSPISVAVSLGGTTTVNLNSGGDLVNLQAVQVFGSQVVNRVDVHSTESATNITREELSRMPVDQSLGSVAMLAPGVVASGATFGGLSFNGSTVAENVVYINGLNVTDPFLRRGNSSVPYGFYQEFQIKTGGYSAEFGRSTGGVINAVTRSGGNDFQGGVELTFEPTGWRADGKDRYHKDGSLHEVYSRDRSSWTKFNYWGSGPIVKDKLFFFGMYESRQSKSQGFGTSSSSDGYSDNGFWGAKLDWRITDNHLFEVLAFSDEAESTSKRFAYNWTTDARGAYGGEGLSASGGLNWSATYTGQFGDNFTVKALYGVNERSLDSGSTLDGLCSTITRTGEYNGVYGQPTMPVGCHPTNSRKTSRDDRREASRLDFEWTMGDHRFRFGVDRESMESINFIANPGDGVSYSAIVVKPGSQLSNGTIVPPGVTQALEGRRYLSGGATTTVADAFYVEDIWNVTDRLLLNLGLRWDSFENKVGNKTFLKDDGMISPRLGFSYDMQGDGSTKLFGNLGRYYLPVTNKVTDYFGIGTTDEQIVYVLQGWTEKQHPETGATYLAPILGPQLGPVNTDFNVPAPTDYRQAVAQNIKTPFQDEAILGFQKALNAEWSWGVNATYRRMTRTLDDVNLNHLPCLSGDWPYINPGEVVKIWCEDTNSFIEVDTSKEGYKMGGSGKIVGFSKPKRTYTGLEFQIDRAWDNKWAFNASYLLSWSEGNFEGPVNSDTGYGDTGLTQNFDHPANNQSYGPLFNDHRHQLKLRGSYKLNEIWSFGATMSALSGGPITGFGNYWPDDTRAGGHATNEYRGGGTFWLCKQNCLSTVPANWVMERVERGSFGRMPWTYNVGANVTWTLPVEGIDLKARFSIYNLTDEQQVVNIHSRYEIGRGVKRPYFGEGTNWQSPRYMQLVVTYNF
ncbi:MAG: TonB-dependent receptor [Luteimonas sp.]